jgi:hypothetical protein
MAIRLFSLTARLGLDGTDFQRGLKQAESDYDRFGNSLKNKLAGTFGAAAMATFLRSVMQTANEIKDLAEQFSIGTDEMQRLQAAAEKSGLQFEDMGAALMKLNALRERATKGDQEAIQSAQRLGLAVDDLLNGDMTGIAMLEKIGVALGDLKLNPETAIALQELFGARKGERLAQALRDLPNTKPPPIFTPQTLDVLDQLELKSRNLWKNVKAAAADSIAGWATVFGMKPGAAPSESLPFVGVSNEDLKEHIRLLRDAQAERERIIGGQLKSGTPEYGRRAMTLLGVNPGLADSFKEDEAMLADAEKELARREGARLKQPPDKTAEKLRADILEQEAKIMERIFKLQMDTASTAEKRAKLEEKIKFHLQGAADATSMGQNKLANEEILKALDLQGDLNALDRGGSATKRHNVGLSSAEQQGAFSGLTSSRAFTLATGNDFSGKNRETDRLEKVSQNTEKTVEVLRDINGKILAGGTNNLNF